MMLLIVAASLVGISSVYQHAEGQAPPAVTPPVTSYQQRFFNDETIAGKILETGVYSSSDGKACLANVHIPTTFYRSDYPLGLKPGDRILLIASDDSICVLLVQSHMTQRLIQFQVAPAPLTIKVIPPPLRVTFEPNERLYKVVWILPIVPILGR